MKKIAVIHNVFPCGGAEKVTIDVADYVTKHNYEFHVLACHITEEHFNIISTKLPDNTDLNSFENAQFIINFIHSRKIDICMLPIRGLTHLDYIQKNNSAKWIFSLHCTPLWEVSCELYLKKREAEASLFKKMEWILLTYPKTVWLKKKEKRHIHYYQDIYNLVDAYTVLCNDYKEILINKLHLSRENNKLHVIYNPSHPIEQVNLNKKKQVVFVGRLTYIDKRIDRLLDIWGMVYKKAPDWELLIIGDGAEKEALQNKAREMYLERVTFVGHTNDVNAYYQDASIICLTSNFEGWPLSLAEGQANGVIPFAFNCSAGLKEMLAPSGVNGFLIPPFKLKAYAKSLLALMNNPKKQAEMRPGLIAKSKLYSPQIIGAKWLDLFNLLIK